MPITFVTDADTGANTTASIQPISNGEPVVETTLRRPSENLRIRTETLKTAALAVERRELEDAGAFLYSEGGSCSIEDVAFADGVDVGVPAITGKYFLPSADTTLVVVSPVIPGGKIVLKRSDFESLYSDASFGDHCLVKRGDCLALKIARSGANSRTERTWGNDLTFPDLATGNISAEAELVKLPSRVILNTPGKTLLTTYGPSGTGAFDADGVPVTDKYVTITGVGGQAAGWWTDQGGCGGDADFPLSVVRITETTIEVTSSLPWRILWPNTESGLLLWSLVGVTTGSNGYITAKDFADYHVIPLVTYTGTGYVFSPSGGFLPDLAPRLLSFSLPISDVADLASVGTASSDTNDEGVAAIGSYVKSSTGDVTTDVYCASNGGVQIPKGTLAGQLTALAKETAKRTRAMTTQIAASDIASVSSAKYLYLDADGKSYVSTDERLVKVWFNIVTLFDAVTPLVHIPKMYIGYRNASDVFTAFTLPGGIDYITLLDLEEGYYEVPLTSAMYSWTPTRISSVGPRLCVKFTCEGTATSNISGGLIQVGALVREIP